MSSDYRNKIKRQIDTLALAIDKRTACDIYDIQVLFDCQEATPKRDLKELRDIGVDIHSRKNDGLTVSEDIEPKILQELLMDYITAAIYQETSSKAVNLMVQKLGPFSIVIMSYLQRAIADHKKVRIIYNKPDDGEPTERIIEPLRIFQSEGYWRVLTQDNGRLKQFLLNRMSDIEILDESFEPLTEEEIDDVFKHSFKSWIGAETYKVRLRIYPPWAERIKPRQLMETQHIIDNKDGSITYETTVNSLNEIASWIVSRGKGIVVLEPEQLKEKVLNIAKGVLENYT